MSKPTQVPEDFRSAFRGVAGPAGVLTFERFMELALYHPELGYYRRDRRRIGYGSDTDFFTASTSGPVFGELVVAACTSLLAPEDIAKFNFVEIGAESPGGVLAGVSHPFASARTIRVGDGRELSGPCIVFSNELFDAQPFRRFVFRGDTWRELGVRLDGERLTEVELPVEAPPQLPAKARDGYVVDAPLAATALAAHIAQQPWSGLFVAFDYGKPWPEIVEACPAGTARAYFKHTQSNDLLARPGEQDLTCHVCWDWLADALERHGFSTPAIETQEAFFIRRAGDFIGRASTEDAARFSPRKLSLLQLLHPGQLGQKFQVLHAIRSAPDE